MLRQNEDDDETLFAIQRLLKFFLELQRNGPLPIEVLRDLRTADRWMDKHIEQMPSE